MAGQVGSQTAPWPRSASVPSLQAQRKAEEPYFFVFLCGPSSLVQQKLHVSSCYQGDLCELVDKSSSLSRQSKPRLKCLISCVSVSYGVAAQSACNWAFAHGKKVG